MTNELIKAMFTILMLVEDSSMDNVKEQAIGLYQIRPIFVEDVNRIAGTSFKHEDARNARVAQQMIYIYLTYYGKRYEEKTGKVASAEIMGRIFNGGPNGYTKEATVVYGRKCGVLHREWLIEGN